MTNFSNRAQLVMDVAGATCMKAPIIVLGTAMTVFSGVIGAGMGALTVSKSNEVVSLTPWMRAKSAFACTVCTATAVGCAKMTAASIREQVDEWMLALNKYHDRQANLEMKEEG